MENLNLKMLRGTVVMALGLGLSAGLSAQTCPYGPDQCAPGYVWRDAFSGDHVCVPSATRAQAAADNAVAASRKVPNGQWGPDTCVPGYVWREANPNDHVCVTGAVRAQTAADNAQAGANVNPACAAGKGPAGQNVAPAVTNAPKTIKTLPLIHGVNGFGTVTGVPRGSVNADPVDPASLPRPLHGWNIASAAASVAPLSVGNAIAMCRPGQVATGGWADVAPVGRTHSLIPMADGSGFTGVAYNDNVFDRTTLTVYAICVDRPSGFEVVKVASPRTTSSGRFEVSASCPSGKSVLGGGFESDNGTYVASASPSPDGSGWRAFFRLDPVALPANREWRVYTTCADRSATANRHLASTAAKTLGPGAATGVHLSCAPARATSVGIFTRDTMIKQASPHPDVAPLSAVPTQADGWNTAVQNVASTLEDSQVTFSAMAICVDVQ